jgi:hypothetical protein
MFAMTDIIYNEIKTRISNFRNTFRTTEVCVLHNMIIRTQTEECHATECLSH